MVPDSLLLFSTALDGLCLWTILCYGISVILFKRPVLSLFVLPVLFHRPTLLYCPFTPQSSVIYDMASHSLPAAL